MRTLMRTLTLLAFSVTAFAQSYGVELNWIASPSPGVGYNVYKATTPNPAVWTLLTPTPIPGLTYTDPIATGATYYYRITAALGIMESVPVTTTIVVPGQPLPPGNVTSKLKQLIAELRKALKLASKAQKKDGRS